MKASLEAAFIDYLVYLVPSRRLGMPNVRLRLKTGGRAAMKKHFQPLAGNEVLKGFALKLTRMGIAHTCQLNVKVMSRKELKFLAYSKSNLKMTKYLQKSLVYFSRL
ncbi:hypothetical protein [Nostoc sp.]|uniref:hypothetical protein n=1 Tax=Nostoc sp. TaxID=1180 RepID=UPI002FF9676B